MSNWLPVISAASGLVGAAIGGAITYVTQRAERRDRTRGELGAALVAFGYTLDSLQLEIHRMPRRTRPARLADAAINEHRFPTLNYLLAWTHAKTIGRDAQHAVDRLLADSNRLLLLAPTELLPVLDEMSRLLGRVSERDATWDEEWSAMRAELTAKSRQLLGTSTDTAQHSTVTAGDRDT